MNEETDLWEMELGENGPAILCRPGRFGKNAHADNCHTIEFGKHYNGSGAKAMNGSTNWPVLKVELSFVEGMEDLRAAVAERIKQVIDEMLPGEKCSVCGEWTNDFFVNLEVVCADCAGDEG